MEVTLYADPACPWCWSAHQWLDDVTPHRELTLMVRPMSLLLRDGADGIAPPVLAARTTSHRTLRVLSGLEPHQTSVFFRHVCEQLWSGKHPVDIETALAEAGADPRAASRADDDGLDDLLEQELNAIADVLPGADPRIQPIPVIRFGDTGWAGPLLDPHPAGEEAVRLWDALTVARNAEGFVGLSRPLNPPHSLVKAVMARR